MAARTRRKQKLMPGTNTDAYVAGPPEIQGTEIVERVPIVRHGVPLADAFGLSDMPAAVEFRMRLIRSSIASEVERIDPEDLRPNNRDGARKIMGWKRTWVIDRMHVKSPSNVTQKHVDAATRLLTDHEMRGGARPPLPVDRVNGTGDGEKILTRAVMAGIRVERAKLALGDTAYSFLFRTVVLNWTLDDLAAWLRLNPSVATGRVQAALERLREHYQSDDDPRATKLR